MRAVKLLFQTTALGVLAFGATACRVDQQEAARAPTVDIDVEAEPGRWPQYDVDWADVDVGTEQRSIEVPVVRVVQETRTVTVPYIRINPPGNSDLEERTVTIELDVPHVGYQLHVTEVRASRDDLWVVGELRETKEPAAQALSRVSDQVVVNAPEDLDVRKVIVGERPVGVYNQQYRFVDNPAALDQLIPSSARLVYRRNEAPATQ